MVVYEALTSIQMTHLTGGTNTLVCFHTLLKLYSKTRRGQGDHINLQELRAENRLGPTLFYNIRNQTYTSPSLLSLPPPSQEIGRNFSGELPKRQLVVHTPNPSPYGEDQQNQEAPLTCIEFSSVSKCWSLYSSILNHSLRSYYVQGTILSTGDMNKTVSLSQGAYILKGK